MKCDKCSNKAKYEVETVSGELYYRCLSCASWLQPPLPSDKWTLVVRVEELINA